MRPGSRPNPLHGVESGAPAQAAGESAVLGIRYMELKEAHKAGGVAWGRGIRYMELKGNATFLPDEVDENLQNPLHGVERKDTTATTR